MVRSAAEKKEAEGRGWCPHGARQAAHWGAWTDSILSGADHVDIMVGSPRHREQEKVRLETRPKYQSRAGLSRK